MELSLWGVFLITSLVTTIAPGPNTLLVMVHAVRYGLHASLLTVVANLSSQFVFMLLVIFGFGVFLAQTPQLYFAMKTAGAIYLIWLGIKFFRNAGKAAEFAVDLGAVAPQPSAMRRFAEAFLVSCSNPKTVLFLSALLPQFLDPAGNLWLQFVVMYVTNALVILAIHLAYGQAALSLKGRIVSSGLRKRIGQLAGATFASLGIGLLTSRAPT